MRTYKGQAFSPTRTVGPKRRKPKPLKRLDFPDRDKLVKPVGKKRPSRVLSPAGRKGRPRTGRPTPGRGRNAAPPVDPFAAQVKAALDLKYSGEFSALQQEAASSQQQHANTQGWYDSHLNDLEKAAGFTTMAYGQGQGAVYAQGNLAAGQDQARMAQNQQAAQQSAALRGTSASPQVEQAGAIGARQAQSGAFGGLLAAHGGAAATLNAGRYAAGGAARVGAHQQEQAREVQVRAEARKLTAQRAADAVTTRREFEDDAFKRELLTQQFGLDVRQQKALEKDKRRQARLDRAKLELDRLDTIADNRRLTKTERRQRDNLNETIRHHGRLEEQAASDEAGRNARDNGSGGGGAPTPSQKRGYRQDYDQAVATLKSAYTYKNGKFSIKDGGKTYTYDLAEMATIIVRDMDVPPEIAKAAVYKMAGRPAPRALARKVRRLGVKAPRPKPPPLSQLPGPF